MIVGSKLLKGTSHQYFVQFCKQSKKLTNEKHIFDHVIYFMIQHSILIELSFSVNIQFKSPSGTLGGPRTHYKLDVPKIIHIPLVSIDNSPQRQLAPDDSSPVSGQFAPSLWTICPQSLDD